MHRSETDGDKSRSNGFVVGERMVAPSRNLLVQATTVSGIAGYSSLISSHSAMLGTFDAGEPSSCHELMTNMGTWTSHG
jgi:hypothetical protein